MKSAAQPEESIERDPLPTLIGRQVLRALGTPKDLIKVRVYPVAADTYRVNVVTGTEYTGRITHSYFLTADEKGNIGHSSPKITKVY